jgi:hypothetical protein
MAVVASADRWWCAVDSCMRLGCGIPQMLGTVVVGLARNDACFWRVVACLRSTPWMGYWEALRAVCCATLSGVSQSAGLFVEPGARRSRIMKT